jgi:hypothetical protein
MVTSGEARCVWPRWQAFAQACCLAPDPVAADFRPATTLRPIRHPPSPAASPRARLPALRSAPAARWSSILVYEVGQQGALAGPFDAEAQVEAVGRLPAMAYSHMAYVCNK